MNIDYDVFEISKFKHRIMKTCVNLMTMFFTVCTFFSWKRSSYMRIQLPDWRYKMSLQINILLWLNHKKTPKLLFFFVFLTKQEKKLSHSKVVLVSIKQTFLFSIDVPLYSYVMVYSNVAQCPLGPAPCNAIPWTNMTLVKVAFNQEVSRK